jgi:bifunctional DNA-binding transcriptional regulator/antitoxin component of YhaV-PrlF toxin-antitoxin module
MKVAESRVTARWHVPIPVEVRRLLGLSPGMAIEWDVEGDTAIVRRVRRHTSTEIHQVLFPAGLPAGRSLDELKDGIREHMKQRRARR